MLATNGHHHHRGVVDCLRLLDEDDDNDDVLAEEPAEEDGLCHRQPPHLANHQQLDLGHLCQELETKCLISQEVTSHGGGKVVGWPLRTAVQGCCLGSSPHRARSYSETAKAALVQTVSRKVATLSLSGAGFQGSETA